MVVVSRGPERWAKSGKNAVAVAQVAASQKCQKSGKRVVVDPWGLVRR